MLKYMLQKRMYVYMYVHILFLYKYMFIEPEMYRTSIQQGQSCKAATYTKFLEDTIDVEQQVSHSFLQSWVLGKIEGAIQVLEIGKWSNCDFLIKETPKEMECKLAS